MKTILLYFSPTSENLPFGVVQSIRTRLLNLSAFKETVLVSNCPELIVTEGKDLNVIQFNPTGPIRNEQDSVWTVEFLDQLFMKTGILHNEAVALIDMAFLSFGDERVTKGKYLYNSQKNGAASKKPLVSVALNEYSPVQAQCSYNMQAFGEIVLIDREHGGKHSDYDRPANELKTFIGRDANDYEMTFPFYMNWDAFKGHMTRDLFESLQDQTVIASPSLFLELPLQMNKMSGLYLIPAGRRLQPFYKDDTTSPNAYIFCGNKTAKRLLLKTPNDKGTPIAGIPVFGDDPGFTFAGFVHDGGVGLYVNASSHFTQSDRLRVWPIFHEKVNLEEYIEHALPETYPDIISWRGQNFYGPLTVLPNKGKLRGFYFLLFTSASTHEADYLEPMKYDFSTYPDNFTYHGDHYLMNGKLIHGRQLSPQGIALSTALLIGTTDQIRNIVTGEYKDMLKTVILGEQERVRASNNIDLLHLEVLENQLQ